MQSIAIIGAGIAGLTLANRLKVHFDVTVFDKSRGVGGRMSTRYAGDYEFDHGAQYVTASDPDFMAQINALKSDGDVAIWTEAIATPDGAKLSGCARYVGMPRMNSWPKAIARNLTACGVAIKLGVRVERLNRSGEGTWSLLSDSGEDIGRFDWVISTAPAPQAAMLMPSEFIHAPAFNDVIMQGCFTVMLGFKQPMDMPFKSAKFSDSPVGWITLNSAKPGRYTASSIVIQSSNIWAESHLEADKNWVMDELIKTAEKLMGVKRLPDHKAIHRWRYASTLEPLAQPYLLDTNSRLACCGDWCLGSKIESAFMSASALGADLLTHPV